MIQTVDWTTQVQINGRAVLTAAQSLQVLAVIRMSIMIPAEEDRTVRLFSGDNGDVALLMVSANQYVDLDDERKTLRMAVATDADFLDLLGPFFLADAGMLDEILGEDGTVSFANPMQIDVTVEIFVCKGEVPTIALPDDGLIAPNMAGAAMPQDVDHTLDDLTQVNGIGPTYRQRLNDAGFHTLSQLADASVERIEEVISARPWQATDIASWIAQAQLLVEQADSTHP